MKKETPSWSDTHLIVDVEDVENSPKEITGNKIKKEIKRQLENLSVRRIKK